MELFAKGDLVQVIRPTVCCNEPHSMGCVGVIEDIAPSTHWYCRGRVYREHCAIIQGAKIELSRLKKLDAPLEDETIDTAKEVTE